MQGTNNYHDKNSPTSEQSADHRDGQIKKLQQQINFLLEERKRYRGDLSKNEAGAFRQSQTGTQGK